MILNNAEERRVAFFPLQPTYKEHSEPTFENNAYNFTAFDMADMALGEGLRNVWRSPRRTVKSVSAPAW